MIERHHDLMTRRITNVYNVLDYGAVADGVTDDSAAIQTAIDACASQGGGTVLLAGSTSRLATGLIIQPVVGVLGGAETPPVSVLGVGQNVSVLSCDAGVTALTLKCGSAGMRRTSYEKFGVRNGLHGIHIADMPGAALGMIYAAFRDLNFWYQTGSGLYSDATEILNCTFEQINATACDYGAHFSVSAGFNCNTFRECQWRGNTTRGFFAAFVSALVFTNNLWESNQQTALEVNNIPTGAVVLDGGWFESNGQNLTGGPYPNIILRTDSNVLRCRNFICNGVTWVSTVNDGGVAIAIRSDWVDWIILNGCWWANGQTINVGSGHTSPAGVVFTGNALPIVGTAYGSIVRNPPMAGVFTMADGATKSVAQPLISWTSTVALTPTNASAAALIAGTSSLYVSAISMGTGFTVATADGGNAKGTETFSYVVLG